MISRSTDYVVLEVHPSNYEALPDETRHSFADYDFMAPPLFVTSALFIPLPSQADKDKIIANLENGLAHTLERIPVFAGKLQFDPITRQPLAVQKKTDTVVFGVHHLDRDPSFPSLSQWAAAGYPDDEISKYSEQLSPPGVEPSDLPIGIRIDAGCVMSAFQLNFIGGGVILVSAFHHFQGDAATFDMFCKTWSENTKAFAEGSSCLSKFKPSFDRTYFTKPDRVAVKERVDALLDTVKGMQFIDVATAPAATETNSPAKSESAMPSSTAQPKAAARTFHVSTANCARLKKLFVPFEKDDYVSTFDCLVALIWRAMMRSRKEMHSEWDNKTQMTRLMASVNIRDRFSVTSKQYIGYGIANSQTYPIAINTLLSQSIGETALMSRQAILDITPSTIPDILELARALEGVKQVALDGAFHFGADVIATSWANMDVWNYDFGFGLASGFRMVPPLLEGGLAIYPRCPRRGDTEGFELCVRLEEGCLARMCQDPELAEYTEIRGGRSIS